MRCSGAATRASSKPSARTRRVETAPSGIPPIRAPITGRPAFHPGLDVSVAIGTVVRAPGDGVVFFAERESGYGRVVNVASVAGLMGTPAEVMDAVGYSTSKAALIGLTRDLAVKWARQGITVNAIAPGFFHTRMSEALLKANEDRIVAATPLGRIGAEGELKGVVALLASQAGAYITGQVIAVDGGMSAM